MELNPFQVEYIDFADPNTKQQPEIANPVKQRVERRSAPRRPVIKSGKIFIDRENSKAFVECLVIDESLTGALVDIGTPVDLPEKMTLQINGRERYLTRRVWVSGTRLGLEFIGKKPLENAAKRDWDLLAFINGVGETTARFGEWLGEPGSGNWIEDFSILAPPGVIQSDLSYQVLVRPDCFSSNFESGRLCGARGMETPLLGIRIQLSGEARNTHEIVCRASFLDGRSSGQTGFDLICSSDSFAPLEAIYVTFNRLS